MNSIWLSIGLSILVLAGHFWLSRPTPGSTPSVNILDIIEAKILDLRFLLRNALAGGKRPIGDDIVIVGVIERTEEELGRWQSTGRGRFAELIRILHAAGAIVIGFDVNFAEPDPGAASKAIDDIQTWYDQQGLSAVVNPEDARTFFQTMQAAYNYDDQLAEALRQAGNVILGEHHVFSQQDAKTLIGAPSEFTQPGSLARHRLMMFFLSGQPVPLAVPHSFGVKHNHPKFAQVALNVGHFVSTLDHDGYVRSLPLLVEYQQEYYPALSLEIARVALGDPSMMIRVWETGLIESINLGSTYIPVDEHGRLVINFYGPARTFPHYSIADVILGRVNPDTFKNKIVLVGFTDPIYQDVQSVPLQAGSYPGVEIHATIIENILRNDFLTQPGANILIDGAILVGLGVLLGIMLHWVRSLRWVFVGAAVSLCLIVAIALLTFLVGHTILNITVPGVFIILDYVTITSFKYLTEEQQRRIVRDAFEHYVSPTVVRKILEESEHPTLQQEQKTLSIIFSDIRGFTKFSEGMDSQKLTDFLEEYFSPMIEIVGDYQGTVDKFIGDAIMVFYGAPHEQPDHAVRACKTAVEMVLRVKELGIRWSARGLPQIEIGLGINTGPVSVGNIGAKERFNYTVMGDNVNLASRLEGVNKEYGTNIIISQFTHALLPPDEFIVRELDIIRVKGKAQPVTIYELSGYGAYFQQKRQLAEHTQGIAAYRQRQWENALAIFQEILREHQEDKPTQLYIRRCMQYKDVPPPEDWDGVFEMKMK